MPRIAVSLAVASALAIAIHAGPAQAQLARSFVSSVNGNDANDCTRSTPCRTFQRVHDNTLANGEITVLDPGGYGAMTITKSISIINDGVGEAGVLVSGGATGITINAGATDTVSLRGLTIKGIGFGGGNGIRFNSGGTLTIENCTIRTLDNLGFGIIFQPNGSSHLAMVNTLVADNSAIGVFIQPRGAGSVRATLSRVQLINNVDGLSVFAGVGESTADINVVVEDSIAAKNNHVGFIVGTDGPSRPRARLMMMRSVAAHNGTGIVSQGGANAILRISQSTITGNGTGWFSASFGLILSYVDNNIDGNDAGDAPIPNVLQKK